MSNSRLILWSVIYYPSTFLHESAHAIATLIFGGSVNGFTTTPTIAPNGSLYLGNVEIASRYKGFNAIAALAPLTWWAVAVFLLKEMGLLYYGIEREHLVVAINLAYKEWGWDSILSAYGILQLFLAGQLSTVDLKVAFRGLLSPSGIVIACVVSLFVWGVWRYMCGT